MEKLACHLCNLGLPTDPLWLEANPFCCSGCLVVFQILLSLGINTPSMDHPIILRAIEAGLISNPDSLGEKERLKGEKKKIYFQIDNLFCSACGVAITILLEKERGVLSCYVDYLTDLAAIEYLPILIGKEEIFKKIEQLGYLPKPIVSNAEKQKGRSRFFVAGFLSMNLMMLAVPLYVEAFGILTEGYEKVLGWLSCSLSFPLLLYCGAPLWKRCWVHLKAGLFGMEGLVFLGTFSSFFFSLLMLIEGKIFSLYFDSMGMLLFLVLFGKELEKKAKISAKEKLFCITKTLPRSARLCLEENIEKFVPLEEIQAGDKIKVRSGEKIPLDGEVLFGEGACDESLMTGESLPRIKQTKDPVIGGSLLKRGELTILVTKTVNETFLHQVIELIEAQLGQKKRRYPLVDKFSSLFVPALLLLALGAFFALLAAGEGGEAAFARALTICLISCPCAIGLAVPMSEAFLIANLAKLKVIVRNRAALAFLGKESVYVFDKTGTVTHGDFKLKMDGKPLLIEERGIIKTLALASRHPIACALSFAITEPPLLLSEVEEIPSRGMRGIYQGGEVLLGSSSFLKERGVDLIEERGPEQIGTLLYFAMHGKCITTLILEDRLRSRMKKMLLRLKGVKTLLLSGDIEESVKKVSEKCGFESYQAALSPLEKAEVIAAFQAEGAVVAMVGDGVNDGPALSAANIGISTRGALDLAIHASDLIMTGRDLSRIPLIRMIGAQTNRIIKQNLIWAFGYNTLAVTLALFGKLTPLLAVFAMSSSSLITLLNTLRIKLPFKKIQRKDAEAQSRKEKLTR